MKNSEAAKVLYDIADLLEMQGVDFKPQAYRKAARSVEELSEDVAEIHRKGGKEGLKQIAGIGEGIAEKLDELLGTGKLKYYDELKKKFPAHISELMEVPGLGPKRIKLLHEKLGIKSLGDLEKAAKSHRIASLPGLGEKAEEDLLKGIGLVKKGKERMLLGLALPIARELESRLGSLKFVSRAVVAGSLRRRQETVGDLDILVVSYKPKEVMDFFTSMKDVQRILAKGETKSSVLLRSGLQVDVRVVEEKSFGAALQYFSGDIQHNVKLREIAIRKDFKLNEYGLFARKGSKYIAGKTEEEVYKALGMDCPEPEIRADRGEIEAAARHKLPKLIGYGSIKGDLHAHTTKSDGADGLDEMVSAAKKMGYEYIAITDHSVSERIASGLKEEDMEKWLKEIREFAKKTNGIRVLAGSEVSIKASGELDYSDDILKKMDIVVASVHSRFKSSRDEMTRRIVNALGSKYIDILGHPTGRLISRREPYEADMKAVIKAAVDNNICLEINSQPDRLDLKDTHVREAKEMGAKFVINTDAHSAAGLNYMELGIATARRGWLGEKDVVSTLPLEELPKYFRKIRV
ncbi:DNA polymerase/3'-5' exonuclease PolX [Candidatus Woesearchaeota archaeon]|nr:DNA polymerase/3'-5' exonuclease PolX [Candidatus Woesearchaeota archaeon]